MLVGFQLLPYIPGQTITRQARAQTAQEKLTGQCGGLLLAAGTVSAAAAAEGREGMLTTAALDLFSIGMSGDVHAFTGTCGFHASTVHYIVSGGCSSISSAR